MSYPKAVDWTLLPYGVEIEFVGARLGDITLLPDWEWHPENALFDDAGVMMPELVDPDVRGGEVASPPLTWRKRRQIAETVKRITDAGGTANWSCGLHVHVSLEAWGKAVLLPMLDAALATEAALRALLRPAPHRDVFLPPTTPAVRAAFQRATTPLLFETDFVYGEEPWSTRGGINLRAWADYGTVEFRLPNGSLAMGEIEATVKLCLRWTAAVGRGESLPTTPHALAKALGVPVSGYPPPQTAPDWWPEKLAWLIERDLAKTRGEL